VVALGGVSGWGGWGRALVCSGAVLQKLGRNKDGSEEAWEKQRQDSDGHECTGLGAGVEL
jgi:hypothetical protein